MAKYAVERRCGHVETISLYGPYREREYALEREAEKLCYECYVAERESRNRAAAKENAAAGLPPLQGTEKQVLWAEAVRREILDRDLAATREAFGRIADPARRALAERWLGQVLGKDSAGWWIDRRYRTLPDLVKEQGAAENYGQ